MLFDEIEIDTHTVDKELYVNVEQLLDHLLGSAEKFAQETQLVAKEFGITPEEIFFTKGMVQGMLSIALMLKQANTEYSFEGVETVEDMFSEFWSE